MGQTIRHDKGKPFKEGILKNYKCHCHYCAGVTRNQAQNRDLKKDLTLQWADHAQEKEDKKVFNHAWWWDMNPDY